jgi:hypothetical protein
VWTCDGPKGPGKNEKISRCSWIFMKLGDLKDPIFLIAFKRRVVFQINNPRETPFPNKKGWLWLVELCIPNKVVRWIS